MKKLALPAVDFNALANDFRNLNPKDVGAWPLAPRIATLLGMFALVLAAGWFLVCSDAIGTLELKQQEETKLRDDFLSKKRQSVNLDLYVQQLNEIDRSFGALLKQLPNKSEMESLLIDVNQAGRGRGLQFELWKPGSETVKDFYAELPIAISISGGYHDFGQFVNDVAKLPRIVTLRDVSLAPGKDGVMRMDAFAMTYRYLDDEEVSRQKRQAAAAAGKK